MTGFTAGWLALREAADVAARNTEMAGELKTRFLMRSEVQVVDLGCGTGANLRASAELLPAQQHWTLIDHDQELLSAAREALSAWADMSAPIKGGVLLCKGSAQIEVQFKQADLATQLEEVLGLGAETVPDLVTASALFDLASPAFIRRFAAVVSRQRAVFYTVLTYNGVKTWTPRHPFDRQMTAAFHSHQMTDKGLGIAAGPTASIELSEAFTAQGYSVSEGGSPWRLGPQDGALVAELAQGFAGAVRETRTLPEREIDAWLTRVHTGAMVGHTDTLATPGTALDMDLGHEDLGHDEDD